MNLFVSWIYVFGCQQLLVLLYTEIDFIRSRSTCMQCKDNSRLEVLMDFLWMFYWQVALFSPWDQWTTSMEDWAVGPLIMLFQHLIREIHEYIVFWLFVMLISILISKLEDRNNAKIDGDVLSYWKIAAYCVKANHRN